MNTARREAITALIGKINDLRSDVEMLKDEEQEYYDNIPEALRSGERAESSDSAIRAMEDAITSLENAESSLDDAA